MIWTTGHEEWGPRLLWIAGVTGIVAIAILLACATKWVGGRMGWKKGFFKRQKARAQQEALPPQKSPQETVGIRVGGKHNEFGFNVIIGADVGIDMGNSEHSFAYFNFIEGRSSPEPNPPADSPKKLD